MDDTPPAAAEKAPARKASARRAAVLPAFLGLLVPLTITLFQARASRQGVDERRQARFQQATERAAGALAERLGAYEQVLRGCVAFLDASRSVTREEWREYVTSLRVDVRYPGIRRVGFALRVPHDDLAALPARLEELGAPGLELTPPGTRPDYFPIVFIEPRAANLSALGFDMGSESRRREAAEQARDTGETRVTRRVALVQDSEPAASIVILLPVYWQRSPLGSVEERRAAHLGWVYAGFRARDLMTGLPVPSSQELDFELYDAPTPSPDALLHDAGPRARSHRGAMEANAPLAVGGRQWTLRVVSGPGFDADDRNREPLFILVGGALASLLLAGMVWSLVSARQRALHLVDVRTRDLKDSEERTRAVVDNVAEGIVVFDAGACLESLNPAAEKIFGRTSASTVGQPLELLLPALDQLRADGQRREAVALRADGSTVPIELAASRVDAAAGTRLVAVVRDITDRKQAFDAVAESEARLRAVVDNLLEGLIIVDPEGVIESVNPAAEALFGYAQDELVGKPVAVLISVPKHVRKSAYIESARSQALGRVSEWEARRRDGSVFAVELSLNEVATPRGVRLAGHIRDVSQRRDMERIKNEFISTVSHELRTPLTSIRGSLGLLSGGALGDLPEEVLEILAIAERNTIRLIALINDILDLERLQAGRLEMEIRDTGIASVVQRAAEAVQAMADQNGIRLTLTDTQAEVRGDDDRLVQVLVNLLSNAIKFSPAGAAVSVRVIPEPESVRVEVVDQGRGVPASHREAIFERFQQVESSDARQKGGTGLGLAISRAIMLQHGGSIGVDSEEGRGSTFWFRVSRVVAKSAGTTRAAGTGDRPRWDDVLIVDDDQALLDVLTKQLSAGRAVRTAMSVEGALAALREARPALLVVDLGLPDGDGAAVVQAAADDPGLKDLPLLIYTGRDLSRDEVARLRLGPTRHLTKSRSTDAQVLEAVTELLVEGAQEAGS